MKKSLRKARITLIVVAALFILPFASAWLLNFNFSNLRPSNTTNHGQLVIPQRPIQAIALHRPDGSMQDANYIKGEWTLLYIGGADCSEMCRQNLYKMRQVRVAQGKNIWRIHRLMVISGDRPSASQLEAKQHYPGLDLVSIPAADRSAWLNQFRLNQNEDVSRMERIYLIDPLGNLMMSYEAGADPRGILKDLERLLRTSYIG